VIYSGWGIWVARNKCRISRLCEALIFYVYTKKTAPLKTEICFTSVNWPFRHVSNLRIFETAIYGNEHFATHLVTVEVYVFNF
jgi:hypothetical protein